MGLRAKKKAPRRRTGGGGARTPASTVAQGRKSRADARRNKYRTDAKHADKLKGAQRERYAAEVSKDRESPLAGGLLTEGTEREVRNGQDLSVVEVFTKREAAAALGCTLVTLRKWIADELIPDSRLVDAVYGYDQYSRGELEAMRVVLVEHQSTYKYLRAEHVSTVQALHRTVQQYRRTNW